MLVVSLCYAAAVLRSVGKLELDEHTVLKLDCLHDIDEDVDIIATDKRQLGPRIQFHFTRSVPPALNTLILFTVTVRRAKLLSKRILRQRTTSYLRNSLLVAARSRVPGVPLSLRNRGESINGLN